MAIATGQTILAADLVHIKKYTLTADEDLTAGQPVGISAYLPSGRMARARRYSLTASTAFSIATSMMPNSICPIGGDKFIYAFGENAGDQLVCYVGTVNPATKTITLGTGVAATADILANIFCVSKLGTDKFIVFYMEDASTTVVKYRVGTVSGTVITFGSAATVSTAGTSVDLLTSDYLSADKGVMVFGCSTATSSRIRVFTVSGTVATFGTEKALNANTDDSTLRVKTIGTDKFIVANNQTGYAAVGTCTGTTTVTLGADVQFATTFTPAQGWFDVVSPATDVVVISWRNGSGNNLVDAVAGTISGTVITFGSVLTSVVNSSGGTGMYAESSTSILFTNTNNGTIVKVTRSGTTLTLFGEVIDQGGNEKMLAMDNGYYVSIGTSGSTDIGYHIQGMSLGFIGIVQTTVSRGNTAEVILEGIDTHQSGLVPGAVYLANAGTLTKVANNVTINSGDDLYLLKAISATEVLLP